MKACTCHSEYRGFQTRKGLILYCVTCRRFAIATDCFLKFPHLSDEEKSMVRKFADSECPLWELENSEYTYNEEGYLVLLDTPEQ